MAKKVYVSIDLKIEYEKEIPSLKEVTIHYNFMRLMKIGVWAPHAEKEHNFSTYGRFKVNDYEEYKHIKYV